jgi:ABC-type nitrate/sulfonate/bicarbonate transport system permease component
MSTNRKENRAITQLAVAAVVPILLIASWQFVSVVFKSSFGPFFPAPSAVMSALWDWATGLTGSTAIYSGHLIDALRASIGRIILG